MDDGLHEAARLLGERSRRQLPYEPAFSPLEPPPGERPAVAAVDGSSAVLVDNGSVWVVATRAVAAKWPGPPLPEIPITISAAVPDEAEAMVHSQYIKHGLEAPPVRSADGFAEAIRALDEWACMLDAVRQLPVEGLLLLDGALERLPDAPQQLVDRVVDTAAARGVVPVAIAKKSQLEMDGIPLVAAVTRMGRTALPGKAWASPVPRYRHAHVALLHPGARHAFRVDVPDTECLHALLPLCRDAVYTGYPYPLAVAHNAVAITRTRQTSLKQQLGDEVRKHGGPEAWTLMQDFHDVLDRNVPR